MKLMKFLSLAAIVVLLTQCYPEGPVYTDELDLVYTNYNPAYDFATKHTFAMPDKIMKIDDNLINGDDPTYVKDVYASVMLDKIRQNMLNNGWSQVNIDKNPDVMLTPAAYELTTTYYYGYGDYWDWWYGGYYPGDWYYPYPVTTSYSTGSLIVAMVSTSVDDETADGKRPVLWTFVINGLLEGTTSQFNARVAKGIDQAFTQSQYLKK